MEEKIVVAVKGIILYNDKILLIKRSKLEEVGSDTWEFAGGKIEFGEQLEEALLREIMEETGLEVTILELLCADSFQTHKWRQVVILTYLCRAESKNIVLSEEHTDYLFVEPNQLKEYLDSNIWSKLEKNDVLQKIPKIENKVNN